MRLSPARKVGPTSDDLFEVAIDMIEDHINNWPKVLVMRLCRGSRPTYTISYHSHVRRNNYNIQLDFMREHLFKPSTAAGYCIRASFVQVSGMHFLRECFLDLNDPDFPKSLNKIIVEWMEYVDELHRPSNALFRLMHHRMKKRLSAIISWLKKW